MFLIIKRIILFLISNSRYFITSKHMDSWKWAKILKTILESIAKTVDLE